MAIYHYRAIFIVQIAVSMWQLPNHATAAFGIVAHNVKNSIGAEFPNKTTGEKNEKFIKENRCLWFDG